MQAIRGGALLLSGCAFAALLGAATVISPQAAASVALLAFLVALRAHSRTAGLLALWSYWLFVPALRRVFDLMAEAPGADPLSLLPFLGTGALALMELRGNRLSRRARRVLVVAAAGFLLGLPAGLLADPTAASFAALAYLAGISALVIGWGDATRAQGGPTLNRALAVALVPLSIYAICQYFLPLTSWDAHWVDTGAPGSIGAPQEGHIRVFSTLNSPFTFAIVLAVGILLGLGRRRWSVVGVLLTLPLIVALALTYVRSAWLALTVGLLTFVFSARGQAGGRVVAIAAVCLFGLVAVGGSHPTTQAFVQRVTSLGEPEEDVSAQERLDFTARLLPTSVRQPVGAGLGQAGLAAQLEGEEVDLELLNVDDGYLALLYQSGPFGLLLVLGALFVSVRAAVRGLGRAPPGEKAARAALLAVLVALLVALASADVFFGLPGAILWYLCGLALALESSGGDDAAESEPALRRQPPGLVQSGAESA